MGGYSKKAAVYKPRRRLSSEYKAFTRKYCLNYSVSLLKRKEKIQYTLENTVGIQEIQRMALYCLESFRNVCKCICVKLQLK